MSPVVGLVVALIVVLTGALLIAFGVRGRRIDDHPTCRRCRFDLSAAAPDTERCPECGTRLVGISSIVIGRRRRIPGMIGAGSLLLVAATPMFGLLAWAGATGFDWNTIKPVGWLVREASDSNPGVAQAARTELDRRLFNAKLSPRELTTVTNRALLLQRSPERAWSPWWGQFMQNATSLGVLPGTTWQEYAAHFAPIRFEYDLAYAEGDSIGFDLVADEARISPDERWWVTARLTGFRVLHAPEQPTVKRQLWSMGRWVDASRPDLHYRWPFSVLTDLEPGLYQVEVEWELRVAGPDSGRAWIADRVSDAQVLELEGREIQRTFDDYANGIWHRSQTIPIVILPKEFRRPVGSSIAPLGALVDASLQGVYVSANPVPHGKAVYVGGQIANPPCDVVFDVWLETLGGEPPLGQRWFVSHVGAHKGESSSFVAYAKLEAEFDSERVDVVFRPCWMNADMRAGISQIWSDTIIRRREWISWFND